jgi:hypothetical protein
MTSLLMSILLSLGGCQTIHKIPILGGAVCLSLASLLWPVWLGSPYREQKVPADIARKVIEARKPPYHNKVETFGGAKS